MSTFLDGREVDSQWVSKVATEHAGAALEKWDQGGTFSLELGRVTLVQSFGGDGVLRVLACCI